MIAKTLTLLWIQVVAEAVRIKIKQESFVGKTIVESLELGIAGTCTNPQKNKNNFSLINKET